MEEREKEIVSTPIYGVLHRFSLYYKTSSFRNTKLLPLATFTDLKSDKNHSLSASKGFGLMSPLSRPLSRKNANKVDRKKRRVETVTLIKKKILSLPMSLQLESIRLLSLKANRKDRK
jgi:hypothetical protein